MPASPIKIKLVEDNPGDARLIQEMLKGPPVAAFEMSCSGRLDEVLRSLERETFDILLLDLGLPDSQGLATFQRVNAQAPGMPIIIFTGLSDERLALEAVAGGAQDYLVKGQIDGVVLKRAIRYAIERKRAEESLRESKERYHSLFDNAHDLVYTHDLAGNFTSFNKAAQKVTGYQLEKVIGSNIAELVAPEYLEQARESIRRKIATSTGTTYEVEIIAKNGSRIPLEVATTLIHEHGKPVGVQGIARDITDRKRAEAALAESENRLRTIIETQPECVKLLARDGSLLEMNRAGLAMIEADSIEQVAGKSVCPLVLPEFRNEFDALVEAVFRGETGQLEFEIAGLRGTRRWMEMHAVPLHDPTDQSKTKALLSVTRDITGRKRTEERQAVIHAVTRVLAESPTLSKATTGITNVICELLQWRVGELWLIDPRDNVLRCVERWCPPGTDFLEFKEMSQRITFAPGVGLPGRVWASGQPVWIADVINDSTFLRAKAAKIANLHGGLGFPLLVGDKVLGVLTFFNDQIQAPDEELLQMFNTLGSQISQFIERKQIEEQLRQSQKMEAVGQLAGGVAHDFNNVLTIIQGYTQLLLTEQNLAPDTKEKLGEVFSAAERAAGLTRQLLAFSRKQVMQSQTLNLNGVIENLSKMLRRIIGEDVTLETNLTPDLPNIQADAGMLEQVLMNLSVNARDAMPNGGQLTVSTESLRIDDRAVHQYLEARAGEFVCLRVEDTGCGMSPEILERIFEPFFTTKGVGEGTGLGLATVYGIVQQHQGWIEVTSQVGKGSSFNVFLPAAQSEILPEEAALLPKVLEGTETILLVEDEAALRGLAKTVLQRHGYRVLEASSGVAALTVWEQHQAQIDLLLTDMVLPSGISGRELAQNLTAQEPLLRVLYSSGYTGKIGDTNFILKEGLNFLRKPYNPEKLLQAVRQSLSA